MTSRTALPLVLALLGLTACGGEDAPATDAPAAEPAQEASAGTESSATAEPARPDCPWLTNAEAAEVLGETVTVTLEPGNQTYCTIDPRTPASGFTVRDFLTYEQARQPFLDMGTQETVAGLGEEASWIVQTETHRYLFVKQGSNILEMTVSSAMPRTDLKEKGEALARVILTHL